MRKVNIAHITFSNRFNAQLRAAPREIIEAFLTTLQLFRDDQYHPTLRNHQLRKKLAGYRSIDVTEDWRAVFKEARSEEQIVITFHLIGTHPELYG
jgi:mRNA-degrading endonuclease YafQ of YafQ-DinJ toxin-antitoxin module